MFISLFKCLVHNQPLTDTQRMTHLQCGMLTLGHLYPEAVTELEGQFGI